MMGKGSGWLGSKEECGGGGGIRMSGGKGIIVNPLKNARFLKTVNVENNALKPLNEGLVCFGTVNVEHASIALRLMDMTKPDLTALEK